MKTGRPECYIPSPTTVSHDVKKVFANTQRHIAKMLQEHDSALNFATDVGRHQTTRHSLHNCPLRKQWGAICMILNIVEVAMVTLRVNLAAAFADILQEFRVSDKVSFNERTLENIFTCILQILCIMCNNTSPMTQ